MRSSSRRKSRRRSTNWSGEPAPACRRFAACAASCSSCWALGPGVRRRLVSLFFRADDSPGVTALDDKTHHHALVKRPLRPRRRLTNPAQTAPAEESACPLSVSPAITERSYSIVVVDYSNRQEAWRLRRRKRRGRASSSAPTACEGGACESGRSRSRCPGEPRRKGLAAVLRPRRTCM
jgi:hypothetical protein